MSKRMILLALVGVALLALSGASEVSSKAHVPLGRVQICTQSNDGPPGKVKTVSQKKLQRELARGACRLTTCVFNDVEGGNVVQQFIFLPGEDCNYMDLNEDGFCDATGSPSEIPKRLSAVNVTPACTDAF